MKKTMIATTLTAGLLLNSFMTYADANSVTRFEYAKELIQQSNIALQETPKSNATEDDNYLYTALQSGLFKGVSFDFDGEMTEEEKQIMLENAKSLMALGVALNIVAVAIQATRTVSFTLVWQFDHNGVFHVVETLAIAVLVVGLRVGLTGDTRRKG